MKKICLTCLILLLGIAVYSEPIPEQAQSGADTPYYMDSQNILREKPNTEIQETDEDTVYDTDDEEGVNEGVNNGVNDDDESSTSNDSSVQQNQTNSDDNQNNNDDAEDDDEGVNNGVNDDESSSNNSSILQNQTNSDDNKNNNDEEFSEDNDFENPINFDATQENVKDKNFKPMERKEDNPPENIKQKVKKEKIKKEKVKQKKEVKQENIDKSNESDDYLNIEQESQSQTQSQAPTQPKTYSQNDYEQMYRDMPVPTFSFVHGVDPDQYYDMKDTTWSPYPLLRLNAPLYFKTIVIQPGYYLLTPRQYKGDWYILFKEAGAVKYTIPVFAKDYTSEYYYRTNLPELDMTKSQRWQIKFLHSWGKYVRSSKRKPETKTNLELTDLDNNFLLIELYYGAYKYSAIFRTEKF